jgi:uncharacterized membrane protein
MPKLALFIALIALVILACKKDPVEELFFPKVKTIIQANCVSCHTLGGLGLPIVFETDEDIASRAATIKAATIDPVSPFNKRMPQVGELTQAEKDIIQKWFDKGGRTTD